jgi:hypothetical protein
VVSPGCSAVGRIGEGRGPARRTNHAADAKLEAVEQELAELDQSGRGDTERRRTLQQHEAYAGQEELVRSEQVLGRARLSCAQAEGAVRETKERLERDLKQARVLGEEWTEEFRNQGEEASVWQEAARRAAWAYADRSATEIRAAFERQSPENASVPLAALRELGRQRGEALQAAEQTWRAEQKATKIHEDAKSEATRLREALALADSENQAAETKVDEAEKTAVRAVANWRASSLHWKLSELAFTQLTEAVLSRANFADVLDPVEREGTRLRDQFMDRMVEAQRELDGVASQQHQAGLELAAWQAKPWASPNTIHLTILMAAEMSRSGER